MMMMDEKKRTKKPLKKATKLFQAACDSWYSQEYRQAKFLFQECLLICEALLGKYHTQTARTYYSMGCSFHQEGNYADALLALRRTMRISTVLDDKVRQKAVKDYIHWMLQKWDSMTSEEADEYQQHLEESIQWEQRGDAAFVQWEKAEAIKAFERSLAIEGSAVGQQQQKQQKRHFGCSRSSCQISYHYRR